MVHLSKLELRKSSFRRLNFHIVVLNLIIDGCLVDRQFYEPWAFLRDQERSSMMPMMAAGEPVREIRCISILTNCPSFISVRQSDDF